MKVLVLNSGSSSQKVCLYELDEFLPDDVPPCLWEAKIDFEDESSTVTIKNSQAYVRREQVRITSRIEALTHLLANLWSGDGRVLSSPREVDGVGHRVVHGGPKYEEPVLITAEVKSGIAKASSFAPLHNRGELEGMEIVEELMGRVPQVAVFDTGFHRKMPLASLVYPGPYQWFEQGIHRYGFHGINHQYCADRAAQLLRKDLSSLKLVTCHLGNGCSLAAIRDGRSVDTTMGFTPLEGLMMGTRSGSIDPGILTYLMRQGHLNGQEIDKLLNENSGLLGVSGMSGDMRQILAAIRAGNHRARLAFDIYIHRLQAGIGAMVAVLAGIDALVFTAGVGENSSEVRDASCSNLEFLGVKVDAALNAKPHLDEDVASADSSVRILVIRAQEDWAIARQSWRLLRTRTLTQLDD